MYCLKLQGMDLFDYELKSEFGYYSSRYVLVAMLISICLIIVLEKHIWKKIIMGYLQFGIIFAVILNPFCMWFFDNCIGSNLYSAYYRLFWMLLMHLIIAYATMLIFCKSESRYRYLYLVMVVCMMIVGGTTPFKMGYGFKHYDNIYKLDDEILLISNHMLENEEQPYVISYDWRYGRFIRSYSGDIKIKINTNVPQTVMDIERDVKDANNRLGESKFNYIICPPGDVNEQQLNAQKELEHIMTTEHLVLYRWNGE